MKRRHRLAPRFSPHIINHTLELLEQRLLFAVTLTVTDTSDSISDTGSLRYAINHTASGDTINFNIPTTDPGYSASTGTFTFSLSTQLELAHNLTITGSGAALLTLSGNSTTRAFQIDAGVTANISGMTIANGSAFGSLGGGVYAIGTAALNLSGCTLTNCSASYGGALDCNGATSITNCTFSSNFSVYGGAIYSVATGALTVIGSTFSGNSAGNGGAILSGNMTLTGSTFIQDTGTYGGALESVPGSVVNVGTSSFSLNSAGNIGGAIVTAVGSTLNLNGCTFAGNSAGRVGGGVFNNGICSVTSCGFTGNIAGNIPGSPDGGGGVFNNNGAVLTIGTSTFSNNAANGVGSIGGGMLNAGSATVSNSTFFGNTAAAEGGGISSYGIKFVIVNSTLAANSAGTVGGAIASGLGGSPLTVINSTVSGNSALQSGGGIYVYSGATGTVNNAIIVSNTLVTSFAPSDVFGTIAGSSNLIGTGGSGGLVNGTGGNLVGVASPGLAPLGNYGGGTMTMALRLGSPAYNTGSNALAIDALGNPLATDQRGLPRVSGAAVDMGAYEAQPLIAPAGLQATSGADQVTLTWAGVFGAADYSIYRGTSPGAESSTPIATGVTGNKFIDTNVVAGTTIYYRVAASDAVGTSAMSNEASATPSLPILNATTGNDLIVLTADPDAQHIDWSVGASTGQVLVNDAIGLTINGINGSDTIVLNQANGNPLPRLLNLNGTFTINGLQGNNPLAGRTWNVNQSTVFVTYNPGSDPVGLIQTDLGIGYNTGTWNGIPTASNGVITSTVAASAALGKFGVGYADSASGVVIGQPANTVEIRYTVLGDANLDRVVNLSDANRLQANWNASGNPSWDRGNFNYDASINVNDALLMVRNWNVTASGSAVPAALAIPVISDLGLVPVGDAGQDPPQAAAELTILATSNASARPAATRRRASGRKGR